ncbi:hypothetical protein [Dolosigranulum savutiense]|uniref:Uncharacterized protein n=1 Tax=Dolosigranulum savutiense TaxID=3110288 RepID=A0AB74TM52_9LACT
MFKNFVKKQNITIPVSRASEKMDDKQLDILAWKGWVFIYKSSESELKVTYESFKLIEALTKK